MKTVLITGGSSGIGLALSTKFIQGGYRLFWVSKEEKELDAARKVLLEKFPNAAIESLALDLSDDYSQEKVFRWYTTYDLPLDVFINNAGVGVFGYYNEIAEGKELKMLQLNVINSFKLIQYFLKKMTAQKEGLIINICSNTAFQPVPKMAAYGASKAFLSTYSLALSEELKQRKSKVKIMTVYPSAIKDTQFKVSSNMERIRTFEGLIATTKKEVADDIWSAMKKNKSVILSGALHRRTRWLNKLLPNRIINWLIDYELTEKG